MRKVYLDACIAIYLIEKHPDFGAKVEALIDAMDDGDSLCYSPLSRMECLVMPMRKGDVGLIALFDSFFSSQEMLAIEPERFDEAAKLRADFTSLKTPDALHLAIALHHSCDEFWTNDDRLNSAAGKLARNILTIERESVERRKKID